MSIILRGREGVGGYGKENPLNIKLRGLVVGGDGVGVRG